jgi:Ca2+-binding EF-hand superfamily protein
MKTIMVCTLISIFALSISFAHAQQPSNAQMKRLQAKMTTELPKRFAAADTNKDGQLTKEEAKGKMPRVYEHFEAIDSQNRGFVSLQDIQLYAHEQAAAVSDKKM